MADESLDFATVGGNLRLEGFLDGNDTIAYLEADVGPNNNFFSPGGGDNDARIYFNLQGVNQGSYAEAVMGTDADDTLNGNGGAVDILDGLGGMDWLTVADGTEGHLNGGDGNDTLIGGDQNDRFRGGSGDDMIDGGAGPGDDRVRYDRGGGTATPFSHGVFVNLSAIAATLTFQGASTEVLAGKAIDNWGDTDTLVSIEEVRGSNLNDVVVGSAGENFIEGLAGDDYIAGGDGFDTLIGGVGNDTFVFGGINGATIEDFAVGTDLVKLENGRTIATVTEFDTDGDMVDDSTTLMLDNAAEIELLGVTGITDNAQVLGTVIEGDWIRTVSMARIGATPSRVSKAMTR